ncbi:unnamed protein product, partial [Meganyctiphanes norvegica]
MALQKLYFILFLSNKYLKYLSWDYKIASSDSYEQSICINRLSPSSFRNRHRTMSCFPFNSSITFYLRNIKTILLYSLDIFTIESTISRPNIHIDSSTDNTFPKNTRLLMFNSPKAQIRLLIASLQPLSTPRVGDIAHFENRCHTRSATSRQIILAPAPNALITDSANERDWYTLQIKAPLLVERLLSKTVFAYKYKRVGGKKWIWDLELPTMLHSVHPSNNLDDGEDEQNKPFKCTLCNKGFKLKTGLQQHEGTHSTDRPYICTECGKLFRQPTHLQQHMRIHTGEKPYDCPFCDKSFRQRTILNQHLRIHTGEKPYVCMECGKQFRQKAILDQHYRTHLGDKPFACPHPACRKHFREMATLISHMRCHKDGPDSSIILQQAKRRIEDERGYDIETIKSLTRINDINESHREGKIREIRSNICKSQSQDRRDSIDLGVRRTPDMSYNVNRESLDQQQNTYASVSNCSTNREESTEKNICTQKRNEIIPQHSIDKSNETQRSTMESLNTPQSSMPNPRPQMSERNLFPYPHSIFPATPYMMPYGPSDPRQY